MDEPAASYGIRCHSNICLDEPAASKSCKNIMYTIHANRLRSMYTTVLITHILARSTCSHLQPNLYNSCFEACVACDQVNIHMLGHWSDHVLQAFTGDVVGEHAPNVFFFRLERSFSNALSIHTYTGPHTYIKLYYGWLHQSLIWRSGCQKVAQIDWTIPVWGKPWECVWCSSWCAGGKDCYGRLDSVALLLNSTDVTCSKPKHLYSCLFVISFVLRN